MARQTSKLTPEESAALKEALRAQEALRQASEQESESAQQEAQRTEQAFKKSAAARAAYYVAVDRAANTAQQEARKVETAFAKFGEATTTYANVVLRSKSPAVHARAQRKADEAEQAYQYAQEQADYRTLNAKRHVDRQGQRVDEAQTGAYAQAGLQDQRKVEASSKTEAALVNFAKAMETLEKTSVQAAAQTKHQSEVQLTALAEIKLRENEADEKRLDERKAAIEKAAVDDAYNKAVAQQITLEKERLAGFNKTTEAMRDQLRASNGASERIMSFGKVLSSLIRGDLSGAISHTAGFLQRRATETVAGRDRAVERESSQLAERQRAHRESQQSGGPSPFDYLRGAMSKGSAGKSTVLDALPADEGAAGAAGKGAALSAGEGAAGATEAAGGLEALAGGAAAAAGPIGAIVAVVDMLGKAGASAVNSFGSAVSSFIRLDLGGVVKSTLGQIPLIGPAIGAAADQLSNFAKATAEVVSKASPVTMMKFQYAMDDAQAVVGRAMIPVLELFTDAIRLVGDVLASILPDTQDVKDALQPFRDLLQGIREAMAPLVPVIKDFLTVILKAVGAFTRAAVEPFVIFFKALGVLGGGGSLTSSVGAAAKQASFVDVNQYLKQSYASAASLGVAKPPDNLEKQTAIQASIWFLVQRILEVLQRPSDPTSAGTTRGLTGA